MKTSIVNPLLLGLIAVALVACGKDVPSCGDLEATNLVGQILATQVTKDTGLFEEDFKKRVKFAVEQPVVVAHDEKVSSYSCKGVATYKVSAELLKVLQRSQDDKKYQEQLWRNFRKAIGLQSGSDLVALMAEQSDPKTGSLRKDAIHEEIAQILGVDKTLSDNMLALLILRFPEAQRNKQIQEKVALIEKTSSGVDEKTQSISTDVTYTISKIDGGDKKFKVEAKFDSAMLEGIQMLELVQSADLLDQKLAADAQAVKATAATAQGPASNSSPPATTPSTVPPSAAAIETIESEKPVGTSNPVNKTNEVPLTTEVKAVVSPPPISRNVSIEASFDCRKASSKIETLICSTPETANADKRLAAVYSVARAKSGDDAQIKADQRDWMKSERNACDDATCLLKVTENRIQQLGTTLH